MIKCALAIDERQMKVVEGAEAMRWSESVSKSKMKVTDDPA